MARSAQRRNKSPRSGDGPERKPRPGGTNPRAPKPQGERRPARGPAGPPKPAAEGTPTRRATPRPRLRPSPRPQLRKAPRGADPWKAGEEVGIRTAAGERARTQALSCEHFPPCRGCPKIPVPYAEQLVAKRAELLSELGALVPDPVVVHDTVPSQLVRGYRNQARLVFRRMARGGTPHVGLGLYLPGTHRVVHIPRCPIQPERLNAIAASVTRFAEEIGVSVYDEREGTGSLRYLALRSDRARKRFLMTIIVAEDAGEKLQMLAQALHRKHPELVGILLHVNMRRSNVLFAGEDAWLMGAGHLEDQVGRFKMFISPRAFLQVNHQQAEWIYTRLAERLAPVAAPSDAVSTADTAAPEVVLDLYCGIGGIALHLAAPGRRVIGVEENAEAIDDARRAAHANGVEGVSYVQASVEAFLADPAAHGCELGNVRTVVLNPPRSGCKPGVVEAIAALHPETIAYVSCRPFSLVRDLRLLGDAYRIDEAVPVDMIPLTPHVESLVFLRRNAAAGSWPSPPASDAGAP